MKRNLTPVAVALAILCIAAGMTPWKNVKFSNVFNWHPNEVWISATRGDGLGMGTEVDPFDGSTRAKFDAIMANYSSANTTNMHFRLGRGTFTTAICPANAWFPRPGWIIEGSGRDVTVLQADPATNLAGSHGDFEVIKNQNFGASPTDYLTIKDLTIDANWSDIAATADAGAGGYTFTDGATTSGSATIVSAGAFQHVGANGGTGFSISDFTRSISGSGIPGSTTFLRVPATTITSGSNNVTLPTGVINVTSTADFAAAGNFIVPNDAGNQQFITYTGKSGTTFTGCSGGAGIIYTGKPVTTYTQAVMSANATITASSVSITFGGEKQCAVYGTQVNGSHIRIQRVHNIHSYGSLANQNESFGLLVGSPSIADGTDDIIEDCIVDNPSGNYGAAFTLFGNPTYYVLKESKVRNCRGSGNNSGFSNSAGFDTGGVNLAYNVNCEISGNTFTDCESVYHHDTGSQVGLKVFNNTLIRGWYGFTDSSATAPLSGLEFTNNKCDIQNRNVGGADYGVAMGNSGAVNLTPKVENNTFKVNRTGFGYVSAGFIDMRGYNDQTGGTTTPIVRNNIFDGFDENQPTVSGNFFGNRTLSGELLSDLPDSAAFSNAIVLLTAKSVTVLTAGTPADIATITVPFPRWRIAASTSVTNGEIYAETASGTLAGASATGWTAAGGTGTQMISATTLPAAVSTLVPLYSQSVSNVATSSILVLRQTSNSVNAGTVTFYVPVQALP